MRITDTHLRVLVHASQDKEGRAWPTPKTTGDARAAIDDLLKEGHLKRMAVDMHRIHYGTYRGVGSFIPVITRKGLKELNLE